LPFILEDRINVPQSEVQSYTSILLTSYAAASVLFSFPAGIIADKSSTRQLPFLLGLLALLGATVMLFLGQSIMVLILARVLQGISAAVVWTIGLAMILDTVGSDRLGVTIGSVFSFISVGELIAPVLGGVVYKKARYGSVFAMGVSILALDFLMRLVVVEKKTAEKYVGTQTDDQPTGEPADPDGQEVWEQDEESPLIAQNSHSDQQWKILKAQPRLIQKFPILYCLSNPRLMTGEAIAFTHALLLAVFDATIPTEAQRLFGFDSLEAGLLFIPLVLPYLLLGSLAGKWVDKYGTKPAGVLGMAYLVPVLILLRLPQPGGKSEIIKFCVIVAFCGVGLAAISSPSIVEPSYVVEKYYKANRDFFGEQGPYAQLYAINSMVGIIKIVRHYCN
jgi:MFS family permease